MEKSISKDPILPKDSARVNGYIVSIQSPGGAPIQSYVKELSEIESFISSVFQTHPGAIVFISASVIL